MAKELYAIVLILVLCLHLTEILVCGWTESPALPPPPPLFGKFRVKYLTERTFMIKCEKLSVLKLIYLVLCKTTIE